MKRFLDGQRVKVVDPDEGHTLLLGKQGTVRRIRISDNSAWVEMDDALPEKIAQFPPEDRRARHIDLYPDECELVA